MVNAAIVEDNVKEAQSLKEGLARYSYETGEEVVVHVFDDPINLVQGYKPIYDVIFLDIELPNMSGIDAAQALRKLDDNVIIIFVTNMVKYAVQGYKVGALDYFVKPVTYYDLKLRMEQVRMSMENRAPAIVIPLPDGVKSILSSKIYYIEIMNHQLTYHTTDGDYSVSSGVSLVRLEKHLGNVGFIRCSSSYLVNLNWCKEFKADTVRVGNDVLKISRGMKNNFISSLSKRLIKKW